MVCIPCRLYEAGYEVCRECGGPVVTPPRKWSPPKRNNERAWKRIEKGEWLWDRRRVARSKRSRHRLSDTVTRRQYRSVLVKDCDCGDIYCKWRHQFWRSEVIPGTEITKTNFDRLPDVDMGG